MGRLTDIAEEMMTRFFGLTGPEARRLYTETSGLPFPRQLETLFPQERELRELAASLFETKKRDGYMEESLYPDTLATLWTLRARHYRIVISSNSEQDLVTKLVSKLGLKPDLALGFEPPMEKGATHFQHILETFGVSGTDLVFVGDSIKDGERAAENNIDFIGKTGTFSKTDFEKIFPEAPIIATLAELTEIL